MRFSWLDKQILNKLFLLSILDICLFICAFFVHNSIFRIIISILIFLIALPILQRVLKQDKGHDGEFKVALELKKLFPEYSFVRNINQVKKPDIDFVVIGPSGVWVLEVKNIKAKKIQVIKEKLCDESNFSLKPDPLDRTYAQSQNIQDYLRTSANIFTPVHPVIVFVNLQTEINFGFNLIEGVSVIRIDALLKLLQNPEMNNHLSPEKCKQITEALNKLKE